MLGCDFVGDFNALHQIFRHDDFTIVINGSPGDFLSGKQRKLALQFVTHSHCQFFAVRHQHRAGQLVVLCLTEQVRRHMNGIAFPVGDHQDLAGPGDHVDGHHAEDLLLGLRHKGVAGADDLIHLGDALRAVGQSRDGLRAAYLEYLIHTGNAGSCQDGGVDLPVFSGRSHHDNLGASGNFRGDGVHQHGGRVGRRAAGYVDAHLFNRRHLLAQHHAGFVRKDKAIAYLPGVESPDVCRRFL